METVNYRYFIHSKQFLILPGVRSKTFLLINTIVVLGAVSKNVKKVIAGKD